MKHLYLLLIALCISINSSAYTSLYVQDPRSWSAGGRGQIDSALLTIKPHGAYFEYGLYLTISGGQMASYYDTTEVILDFDLPVGAMVEDSWLWVGNDIVQAELIERNTANNIYEGIVQRRQDPSILFKNSNTSYQLRIFPLPPGQSRKVKISYLVPTKLNQNRISAVLPIYMFKGSLIMPDLTILADTNAIYTLPIIDQIYDLSFTSLHNTNTTKAIVTSSKMLGNSQLSYSLQYNFDKGVYFSIYPTSSTTGYYQFVANSNLVLDTIPIAPNEKKLLVLLDYESFPFDINGTTLINEIRNILRSHLGVQDSFNFMYADSQLVSLSNTWLPNNVNSINSIPTAPFLNPGFSHTNIRDLLKHGVNFIKNNPNGPYGEILLLSNSNNFTDSIIAAALADTIQHLMQPNNIPINIINYTSYTTDGIYGNNYLYNRISMLTAGKYQRLYTAGIMQQSFSAAANNIFNYQEINNNFSIYDINIDFQDGFTYAQYENTSVSIQPNSSIVSIGKYYGTLPISIEFAAVKDNILYHNEIVLNNTTTIDSFTRKLWIGKWLNEVENSNPYNAPTQQAIDSSTHHRILSRYTAFLALEPSDTIAICSVCLDPTNPGGPTVGLEEDDIASAIGLSAYPNPFSNAVHIVLQPTNQQAVLKIYNVMGQVMKVFEIDGNTPTITWQGDDKNGDSVPSGIYMVSLEDAHSKQTIRLIKQ